MNIDYDIIIVGSGPAGISVAFPLLESGLKVLMVDGGKTSDIKVPIGDFLDIRKSDINQWEWLVGKDFYALKNDNAASPKLRAPTQAYVFEGYEKFNKIIGQNFNVTGSLASGGLSNAWGCGVACFSDQELTHFPFSPEDIKSSYINVIERMGISGKVDDDLSDYFGLDQFSQPPIKMDNLHEHLLTKYLHRRGAIFSGGFTMGRSRVAALSSDLSSIRKGCNLSGNCLWGCERGALYSASYELNILRKFPNFYEMNGFIVENISTLPEQLKIHGFFLENSKRLSIVGGRLILAAGTLASTRLVLKGLNYRLPLNLLSSPTAAFLIWIPKFFGSKRISSFGLGQLSFTVKLKKNITAFGSTFSTTGILISEFVRHLPLPRRFAIDFLSRFLSSCVVGNIFLPGNLTLATVRLRGDDYLEVAGKYDDAVSFLMQEIQAKLRKTYWGLGAILLPGSFKVAMPGSDIHYSGTLPMKKNPNLGETSQIGEVKGLQGVYVVDGACLPFLPEKSHTLTIMANADRIGHILGKQLGK